MKAKLLQSAFLAACAALAPTQSILFNFNNIPAHTPLPVDVTVGGVTAHLSYQSYGYSIQQANVLGFTPLLFEGNCLYPNTIYRDDFYASFSVPLSEFSLLFSPQELACGTTATMRVTAYMDATQVGTRTAQAPGPGTWPTGLLTYESATPFNRVVIHYDAPPPSGGDYGVIYLADRMAVSPFGGATTEILAPRSQAVNLGKLDGGSMNSLAARDNSAETICRFIVPTSSSPFVRVTLGYLTTKHVPTRIEFFTVARTGNPGLFALTTSVQNKVTGQFDEALTRARMADVFQYGIASPWSNPTDYVATDGTMTGRFEVYQTGPSTTLRPCIEFDEATMHVSG